MSIKDINKIITITDALTGEIIFQILYTDYMLIKSAFEYTNEKIKELQENEHGALIKIGTRL